MCGVEHRDEGERTEDEETDIDGGEVVCPVWGEGGGEWTWRGEVYAEVAFDVVWLELW